MRTPLQTTLTNLLRCIPLRPSRPLAWIFALLSMCVASASAQFPRGDVALEALVPQNFAGLVIGVDPGHGGTDNGAVGPTGLTEKSVNLATALALKGYLEADGATVVITRTTDATLSLTSRTDLFVARAVNFAISVHHNSVGTPSVNTSMVFIYCNTSLATRGALASHVVQRLAISTGIPSSQSPASTSDTLCSGHSDWLTGISGVGQANLEMVRDPEVASGIPSVLAEISFISNPTEEAKLRNADYLDNNGWAIYAGLADYLGFAPRPRTSGSPAMSLSYNGTSIPNGDPSPSAAKGTDFGNAAPGFQSPPRTFTISNTGINALNFTGVPRVQFGGNNPFDFGMNAQPSTPVGANGGSTTFQLVFQPTAAGLRTAIVTIANDDPNKNPYTFTVQGTGQVPVSVDPALEYNGAKIDNGDQSPTNGKGTDFGSVDVGSQSATHSFKFYNHGNTNMTLTGSMVQMAGANSGDFAIVAMPSSPIPPNQYATIGIQFEPSGPGLRVANLLIYFDATYALGASSSPYAVALQGTSPTLAQPTITSFNGNPTGVAPGDAVTISYTVADMGGPGLKQVELWRFSQSAGVWSVPQTKAVSGTASVSGSFTDSLSEVGSYAYGLHVVDLNGNTKAESDFGIPVVWVTVSFPTGPTLAVSPSEPMTSNGSQGGPFDPTSKTYTVSNVGGGTLNWTATADQNWVTVSPVSGQSSGSVVVSLSSNANALSKSGVLIQPRSPSAAMAEPLRAKFS